MTEFKHSYSVGMIGDVSVERNIVKPEPVIVPNHHIVNQSVESNIDFEKITMYYKTHIILWLCLSTWKWF